MLTSHWIARNLDVLLLALGGAQLALNWGVMWLIGNNEEDK